jgi:hypothetical protein
MAVSQGARPKWFEENSTRYKTQACLCHDVCVTSTVVSDGWDWVEPEFALGGTSDTTSSQIGYWNS